MRRGEPVPPELRQAANALISDWLRAWVPLFLLAYAVDYALLLWLTPPDASRWLFLVRRRAFRARELRIAEEP